MSGSMIGNVTGMGYFLIYQLIGLFMAGKLFYRESLIKRVLLGSVMGSVLVAWFPVIASFVFDFNKMSHYIALGGAGIVLVAVLIGSRKNPKPVKEAVCSKQWFKEHSYLMIIIPVAVFFGLLLKSHIIPHVETGSIHTGQATYGDMNMHLGFITSIANQGTFPPEYSILPGNRLSYPFLCDTISSSIYVWGSSLRFAYIFPMVFAVLQVFLGVMLLATEILKEKAKAVLTWVFFFFNGGFGIIYFLQGVLEDPTVFTRIFTTFYQTPTNYVDENIRWSNIIVDMLLPQRATLFGWSVLIPTLLVLYKGIRKKRRSYFVMAGILGGALPMIHTHSFLALAFICAMWLIYALRTERNAKWRTTESKIELVVLFAFFLIMCVLDGICRTIEVNPNVYLGLGLLGIALVGILCIYFAVDGIRRKGRNSIIVEWGILLGVVLVLALPQLFIWTFQQAQGEQFVRGYFNWANLENSYLIFYLKNIGIVWIIGLLALIFTKSRNYFIAAPIFFIWYVVELIVFQPNEYDNNKLLYIAYLFLCMLAADYLIELQKKIKSKVVKYSVMTVVIFVSSISALLTMGREFVSDYELYSYDEVEVCKYIEKHTDAKDVILTDTRHNNGVSSLTGRNIVCGTGSFLYYHGLAYKEQEADVARMYTEPQNTELLDKYNVSYVYIGPSERTSYAIVSEDAFRQNFTEVYREGDVVLYKRK